MKWHENEFYTFFYYNESTGLIVGITNKLGTQNSIYIARVIKDNTEYSIGQYINQEFAKKAIERYWDIENRTLIDER
jgi:hypothetical protein